MTMTEEKDGPTPNGGVKSRITYTLGVDACPKEVADGATVLEMDEDGNVLHTTYMRFTKRKKLLVSQ